MQAPTSSASVFLEKPVDGLAALRRYGRKDILSGFLVSLIALPLCLGIAKASGFPAMGGLITAIVGGILVGLLGGAPATIKGPAAGLISIAIGAVTDFGGGDVGYHLTLAVIVVASIFQILFGVIKAGRLGDFFPASAVHGMLAAIGLIIISKQIPVLFGVKLSADIKDPFPMFAQIPHILETANPTVASVGLASLGILILMPFIKNKYIKMVPPQLIVLVVAVVLGLQFNLKTLHDTLLAAAPDAKKVPDFLVKLPDNLLAGIQFPDFSQITSSTSIKYIIMFTLVGSLESLLTVKAIDILDPYKRKSNLNKDLLAVGIGNTLCGFLGGLPMIAEVVRSSANINNGATSRWGNVAHGVFLLIYLVFLGSLINLVPLAGLAAMLIFTGYRLAGPSHWRNAWAVGWEQFSIFAITVVVTLATDLLVGIGAGVLLNIILNLAHGASIGSVFAPKYVYEEEGKAILVVIKDSAVFSNWLGLKARLESIPTDIDLIIDVSEARLIDHPVVEALEHFVQDRARAGQNVDLRGLASLRPVSGHPLSTRMAAQA